MMNELDRVILPKAARVVPGPPSLGSGRSVFDDSYAVFVPIEEGEDQGTGISAIVESDYIGREILDRFVIIPEEDVLSVAERGLFGFSLAPSTSPTLN